MKHKDLTGKKFGSLTVLSLSHMDKRNGAYYKCLCDCGKEIAVMGANLSSGKQTSCGCSRKKLHNDLSGLKFGLLTVIKPVDCKKSKRNQNIYQYECMCECGNTVIVQHDCLTQGHTTSCGCVKQNVVNENRNHTLRFDTNVGQVKRDDENLRITNTSGYTGVYQKNGKWVAQIQFQHHVYRKYCTTKEDAIKTRYQMKQMVLSELQDLIEKDDAN